MTLFFRDITILGTHNVPKTGPVIFCGNHANQFSDGHIMLGNAPRNVRFLVAAKVSPFISYFYILVFYSQWQGPFSNNSLKHQEPFQFKELMIWPRTEKGQFNSKMNLLS